MIAYADRREGVGLLGRGGRPVLQAGRRLGVGLPVVAGSPASRYPPSIKKVAFLTSFKELVQDTIF